MWNILGGVEKVYFFLRLLLNIEINQVYITLSSFLCFHFDFNLTISSFCNFFLEWRNLNISVKVVTF